MAMKILESKWSYIGSTEVIDSSGDLTWRNVWYEH